MAYWIFQIMPKMSGITQHLDMSVRCYICGNRTWHYVLRMSENFSKPRCKNGCRHKDENEYFLTPLENKPWLWPYINWSKYLKQHGPLSQEEFNRFFMQKHSNA